MRTVRLGLANASWCLGSVLGLLLSGMLFQSGGELLVFSAALALEVMAFAVSLWRVSFPSIKHFPLNILSTNIQMNAADKVRPKKVLADQPRDKTSICKLISEPISVAFAKRRGHARCLILLLLLNLFMAYGASCGRSLLLFIVQYNIMEKNNRTTDGHVFVHSAAIPVGRDGIRLVRHVPHAHGSHR